MFGDPDTLQLFYAIRSPALLEGWKTNLLDDVRAKLLNRKSANIAQELTDDTVAEAVVVEIQDVLHDLIKFSNRTDLKIRLTRT